MAALRRSCRAGAALAVLSVAAGLLTGCHHSARAASTPVVRISPATGPVDAPVTISVLGLPADHAVTLTLTGTDFRHVTWTGRADFRTSAQGVVATTQAPTGGSYVGADPMGLFETMAPPAATPIADDVFLFDHSTTLTLDVVEDGKVLASHPIVRSVPAPAHRRFTLAADGFVGTVYEPADTASTHPAVLVFGGSEGGEDMDPLAALLASHGYPTLSLAYFKAPGLPSTLADIDLHYFVKALRTLDKLPGVDPTRVVVYGISRGSEAAQLLGSLFPKLVHGVIAGVPSSVVNGPYPEQAKPSWLLAGHVIPEVPTYLYGTPDPVQAQNAVLKDELIRGPILLACAGQDAVWPSCPYQDAIVARLKAHHFAYPITALRYADGGHGIGAGYRYNAETSQRYATLGGDLLPTQQGRADVYQHVLDLLSSLR